MKYTDFYVINNDDELTRQIIYSNLNFNIDNLFGDEDSSFSITIITPNQSISVSFDYDTKSGGHATIADIILSRLYPHYERCSELGDPSAYFNNRENIFIITRIDEILVIRPEDGITEFQFLKLKDFMNKVMLNNKIKNVEGLIIHFNDDYFTLDKLQEKTKELEKEVCEKEIPSQYPIGEIDFSNCSTKEEIDDLINNYINKNYHSKKGNKK